MLHVLHKRPHHREISPRELASEHRWRICMWVLVAEDEQGHEVLKATRVYLVRASVVFGALHRIRPRGGPNELRTACRHLKAAINGQADTYQVILKPMVDAIDGR